MNHFDRKEGSFMKGKRGLRAGALLCVAALGCALGAGCSGGEVAEPVYEDNKALHIGAWVAPPPDFISDETYKVFMPCMRARMPTPSRRWNWRISTALSIWCGTGAWVPFRKRISIWCRK